jgi:UbiD family decarboxylase
MDIQGFLSRLEEADEIIRIRKEVSPEFEACAVIGKIQRELNKAVFFNRVKGHNIPLASNLFGSFDRVSTIFGSEKELLVSRLSRIEEDIPCVLSSETSHRKRLKVNELGSQLPIVTHYEKDAGPYITGGLILAKDPESGVRNLSYHRMQWTTGGELRFCINPGNHLGMCIDRAEERGQDLEAVVLIGASPVSMLAGAFKVPFEKDELGLAGALQNDSVKIEQCQDVDLEIPQDASIAIEGKVIKNLRKPEGPIGDWQHVYVGPNENYVFSASVITLSQNPVFYTILPGSYEEVVLTGLPISVSIYRNIKKISLGVKDVTIWPYLLFCIVQMEKGCGEQAKQAGLAALGTNMSWVKYCIVVDEDVDIYYMQDVLWAIATRCSMEKDVIRIKHIPGFPRDPYGIHTGRVIIDATAPGGIEGEFEKKQVPFEKKIRLADYIGN